MNKYKRIEMEEREGIMKKLSQCKSIREKAREIKSNPSSISIEIIGIKKKEKGIKI